MYKVCVQDVWIQVLAAVESPNLEKNDSILVMCLSTLYCIITMHLHNRRLISDNKSTIIDS